LLPNALVQLQSHVGLAHITTEHLKVLVFADGEPRSPCPPVVKLAPSGDAIGQSPEST